MTATLNSPDDPRRLIEVNEPVELTTPLIFASPHSGRYYSPEFLRLSKLERHELRQSEDSYVDLLFMEAPEFGAPLLRALFPRAFVDVNRAIDEVDPRMFADQVPLSTNSKSMRVMAGLGVIPRIVADGHDIYDRKLKYQETHRRLKTCYEPYHQALTEQIDGAMAKFGCAVVVDCHSMPSIGGAPISVGGRKVDFVIGDRFGSSCAPSLSSLIEFTLTNLGYFVSRNAPYAGGFVASNYGVPSSGVHVIQLEINRSLYLDEKRIARTEGFEDLREKLRVLISELTRIEAGSLLPAVAAE